MMWLIPVVIVTAGAVLFFYAYTHFLLGRKTDLKWCVLPGILFVAGVLLRLPFQEFILNQIPVEEPHAIPFSTSLLVWLIIAAAMFVTTIDQTLTRGIWFLPFNKLRAKLFTSLVSVLELGAITGVGSLIAGTVLVGYLGADRLGIPSWDWVGFVSERLAGIILYIAFPTVHLYTMYLYKTTGRSVARGWALGALKAMALHTFANSAIGWLWFRDVHWSIIYIFQLHFMAAVLVSFVCWYRIYSLAEKQESKGEMILN
ncbi:MAG: hypothetical protein AAGB97_07590 [Dehalococcoidia bacterium]|nr:hypothetical protein [Chloroflexota bacterium]MBT9162208.1 hypothetical protein [Chloroflexota bacterium]